MIHRGKDDRGIVSEDDEDSEKIHIGTQSFDQ